MTDFVQDLEAELLAAARRRATRRRPLPRIAWRPAVAVLVLAALVVAGVAALRPSEREHPATPNRGAFILPYATPVEACDGTQPPPMATTYPEISGASPEAATQALAVLRRPYQPSDELAMTAAALQTWLPVGGYDPKTVRRGSVPATYLVPTGDLRTKPLACGGGKSRGPGVCLVMPADYACFTLAEIREGRAFTRNGRYLLGIVPDGVRWVRLTENLGALAVDNVAQQTANGEPLKVVFEHDTPRVAVLDASHARAQATRLGKTLTRVFGTHTLVGNASRTFETTTVFQRKGQDIVLAGAIACYLGASTTGPMSAASWLDVPDDVDFVVVLGERM